MEEKIRYTREEIQYKKKILREKKKKRVRRIRIFSFLIICMMMVASTIYYAVNIEPYRLVSEKIEIGGIANSKERVTVVQFSDTHIKEDFTYENLSKVVDEINRKRADIVIFTGDLYDNYSVYNDDINIINELSRIEARIAKVAAWGNRDYGGGAETQYENIMQASGFNIIKNRSELFNVGNSVIQITALDDSLLGQPIMPIIDASEYVDYNILLTHEPDVIDNYTIDQQDLILAGHTHGGQVNIPFLPFINEAILKTTEFSTNYQSGVNILNEENQQMLYINTGIGTTGYSIRLGVIPQITEFSIYISE